MRICVKKRLAAVAAVFLIASCAPERADESSAAAPDIAPRPVQVPAPAREPKSAPTPSPAPAKAAAPELAVEGEGLRLFAGNGTARALPFGMPQQQLLSALESFRGPADRGTNAECGAGALEYAVWADGLTLHFQEDRFAGWALDPRAEGAHSTASGIGPGSTRRELDAVYAARAEQTSLGTEFSAGALHGVLDGRGPTARITALWAGVSCVFR